MENARFIARTLAAALAVEVQYTATMGGSTVVARSLAVEAEASASICGSAVRARSLAVEVPASVPVGGFAVSAITATPTSHRVRQGAATNAGTAYPASGGLTTEETASV